MYFCFLTVLCAIETWAFTCRSLGSPVEPLRHLFGRGQSTPLRTCHLRRVLGTLPGLADSSTVREQVLGSSEGDGPRQGHGTGSEGAPLR